MIRHVVVDQNDPASRVALGQLLEELRVGCPIEHGVLAEMKPGLPQCDRAKNLLGVPLASGGDARLFSAWRPGLIQTGILPEAGLVFEDQDRPLRAGFFLSRG
jgi:hypothetical protein